MTKLGLDFSAVDAFRGDVRGEVLVAGDAAYDDARALYNAMIDKRPAVIVQCRDVADVVAAVRFGREEGLDIAVRGGGHNGGGLGSVDNGIVIDLSGMRGVRVDPGARTTVADGGALLGDVDHDARLRARRARRHHLHHRSGWPRPRRRCRSPHPQMWSHHRQLPRSRHGAGGWQLRDRQRRRARGPVLGGARRWRQLRRRHVVHAAAPRGLERLGGADALATRPHRRRAHLLPRLHRNSPRGPQRLLRLPHRPTGASLPRTPAPPEDVRHRVVLRRAGRAARCIARARS